MHFSLVADSKAKCSICQKNISFKSGSTDNLHRHLKHPTVKVAEVRREPDDSDNSDNEVSTSGSARRQSSATMNPDQTLKSNPHMSNKVIINISE